jgi:hypothetical protein
MIKPRCALENKSTEVSESPTEAIGVVLTSKNDLLTLAGESCKVDFCARRARAVAGHSPGQCGQCGQRAA